MTGRRRPHRPVTEPIEPGQPRQLPGMARLLELTPELIAHYGGWPPVDTDPAEPTDPEETR